MEYFSQSLKKFFPDAVVWVADANPNWSAVCQLSSKVVQLPNVTDANYISILKDFCIASQIGLVVPTIDTELLILSKHRNLFLELGINLLISDFSLTEIFRNKSATLDFFKQLDITTPTLYTEENVVYPFFYKPIDGSSSKNIGVINSKEEVYPALWENSAILKMEYIDATFQEYSIDLYYSNTGLLKCAVPRLRVSVRDGEINKGQTCKNEVYEWVLKKFDKLNGARGCLTLQIFFHPMTKNFIGIEINPRFGGGYPLSHEAGAAYTEWIIQEYFLKTAIPFFSDWMDNLKFLRYDTHVLTK